MSSVIPVFLNVVFEDQEAVFDDKEALYDAVEAPYSAEEAVYFAEEPLYEILELRYETKTKTKSLPSSGRLCLGLRYSRTSYPRTSYLEQKTKLL